MAELEGNLELRTKEQLASLFTLPENLLGTITPDLWPMICFYVIGLSDLNVFLLTLL